MNHRLVLITLLLSVAVALGAGCSRKDSFEIRDVDPGQAGQVRSLGPESQDVVRLSDLMTRSLLQTPQIREAETPPTLVMLPMTNNSRFAFNQEVFTSRLKAELNKASNGRYRFAARDMLEDIQTEREAKREGDLDYDPDKRVSALPGADYFLRGRVDTLDTNSRKGQAAYAVYTFKLVDAETSIELWEELYDVKKEGRDDVVYR